MQCLAGAAGGVEVLQAVEQDAGFRGGEHRRLAALDAVAWAAHGGRRVERQHAAVSRRGGSLPRELEFQRPGRTVLKPSPVAAKATSNIQSVL